LTDTFLTWIIVWEDLGEVVIHFDRLTSVLDVTWSKNHTLMLVDDRSRNLI
jgi:hypothetical protein